MGLQLSAECLTFSDLDQESARFREVGTLEGAGVLAVQFGRHGGDGQPHADRPTLPVDVVDNLVLTTTVERPFPADLGVSARPVGERYPGPGHETVAGQAGTLGRPADQTHPLARLGHLSRGHLDV